MKNPFKEDEDPYGLAKKKILTKENMQFCNLIFSKAERLEVLDDVSSSCSNFLFRNKKLTETNAKIY